MEDSLQSYHAEKNKVQTSFCTVCGSSHETTQEDEKQRLGAAYGILMRLICPQMQQENFKYALVHSMDESFDFLGNLGKRFKNRKDALQGYSERLIRLENHRDQYEENDHSQEISALRRLLRCETYFDIEGGEVVFVLNPLQTKH